MNALPRKPHRSIYSSGEESALVLGPTWVEPEVFAYPAGGFTRRAYVRIERNPHNPIELPYGALRLVLISISDTFFTVPARLRYRGGKTVRGFVSSPDTDGAPHEFTFTPEANPDLCHCCPPGVGCRKGDR
jgi:hypothetical protein